MPAHPATNVAASDQRPKDASGVEATTSFMSTAHGSRSSAGASARKLSQPPRGLVWYRPSLALETHPATSAAHEQRGQDHKRT